MFFVNKDISNKRLESYMFIDGSTVFPKTTFNICLDIICFKEPHNHPFQGFTNTAG